MLGHHLRHHFDWAFVIKTLARPNIELVRDSVQLLLAHARQIRTLGQVLAEQAINVFVATSLPRAVRVAEVNSYTRALSDFSVARHLAAPVVCKRFTRSQRHAIQRCAEAQWPGVKRSSTSGGRTWMLTRSGIWPRRSTPPERGRRLVLPCRRQMISSLRSSPTGSA